MKLSINKKKLRIVVILLVFTLILIGSLIIYFLYYRGLNISEVIFEDKYSSILSNCSSTRSAFKKEYDCYGFISNEYFIDQTDERCFDVLFYNENVLSQDSNTVCFNENILSWENPYESYDNYVPVHFKMDAIYTFNGYGIYNVFFDLISDDSVLEILNKEPENSVIKDGVYIRENQNVVEAGYYLTQKEGSIVENAFIFYDVNIVNIIEEGKIFDIYFNTLMEGQDIFFKVSVQNLVLFYQDGSQIVEKSIDIENSDDINMSKKFFFTFVFDPKIFDKDKFINDLKTSSGDKYWEINDFEELNLFEKYEPKEL